MKTLKKKFIFIFSFNPYKKVLKGCSQFEKNFRSESDQVKGRTQTAIMTLKIINLVILFIYNNLNDNFIPYLI